MVRYTLDALKSRLKTSRNILDIGTGSGYITAAMAVMAPTDAKVYAVDHIAEINDFAKHNIELACPNMSKKGQFTFVTQDGRKGLSEFEGKKMRYDVIHVGGELEVMVDNQPDYRSFLGKKYLGHIEDQVVVNCENPRVNQGHSLKLDRTLMEQLAPGGKMWVPLASISTVDRKGEQTYHEVYVITRETCKKSQIDPKLEDLRDIIADLLVDNLTEQDIFMLYEEDPISKIPDWKRQMHKLIKNIKNTEENPIYTYRKIGDRRVERLQDVDQ